MTEANQQTTAPPRSVEHGPPIVVYAILFLNLLVFFLWMWPPVDLELMAEHFLVSWRHLEEGRVWVLLTAAFSHNWHFHLLVNLIVLWSFGPPLERMLGPGRFLLFYLIAGVVGSLAHAVVSNFFIGEPALPALGASSALAGVLMLFSFSFPRATVLVFFIIPLPAFVAALAFVGIDIWGLIMQIEGGGLPIGHGAHLGGALVGIVYFLVHGRKIRRKQIQAREA